MKYYKVNPQWAKRLKVTDYAPMHPDGWYLLLPPFALPLMGMLSPEEYGEITSLDMAIEAIGGCIYNESQALASMRGEADYMMSKNSVPGDITNHRVEKNK